MRGRRARIQSNDTPKIVFSQFEVAGLQRFLALLEEGGGVFCRSGWGLAEYEGRREKRRDHRQPGSLRDAKPQRSKSLPSLQ